MAEQDWRPIGGSEWRRSDGVKLTRSGENWTPVSASGQLAPDQSGQPFTMPDAGWLKGVCDLGGFEPLIPPIDEFTDPAGLSKLLDAIVCMAACPR